MIKTYSTVPKQETAVLVALVNHQQTAEQAGEYLDELAFLAETSGAKTLTTFTQKFEKPDVKTFVGKGKLEEINAFVKAHEVDMVIFDDDLSPSQVRNLEKVLGVKILDRSLLILNIFSLRAKTAQAKTQVELAQYQYLLPRLTNMWTHLSKQKGGIGMKGPGETELETDRRIVRDKNWTKSKGKAQHNGSQGLKWCVLPLLVTPMLANRLSCSCCLSQMFLPKTNFLPRLIRRLEKL